MTATAGPVPATAGTRAGAGPATAGRDAAAANVWLWDVFFAAAAAITAGTVVLDDGPLVARIGSALLVLALGAAWLGPGRRLGLAEVRGTRPAVHVACLTVLLTVAVVLHPAATWALWVVLPQAFWLLGLAPAIVVTIVLSTGLPVLGNVSGGQSLGDALSSYLPQGLFFPVFGLLAGVWIHRVIDESDERARLIAELETSRAQVAELSHRAGVTAERERLAGEIHDTLAQGFISIVTLLQAARTELDADPPAARRHVDLAVRAARENLTEARALVAASAPGALATHTLVDAVARQAARFAEESGVAATHHTTGPPRRLPAEHEVVLLRAAQELLANVGRHAHARTAALRLDFTEDGVTLTVVDDGRGFDPSRAGDGSYGLAMMRARVERLGGRLDVTSAAATGTAVTLTLPAGAR